MWSQLGPIARRRSELATLVSDASEVWSELGAPDGFVAGELAALNQRLKHQHATVGVFGLIKRGKSTLVNALVGAEASRMRAVPETAVPVRVTHSEAPFARVHVVDGRVLRGHVAGRRKGEGRDQQGDECSVRHGFPGLESCSWAFRFCGRRSDQPAFLGRG